MSGFLQSEYCMKVQFPRLRGQWSRVDILLAQSVPTLGVSALILDNDNLVTGSNYVIALTN